MLARGISVQTKCLDFVNLACFLAAIIYGNAERRICNGWIFKISKVPAKRHADCWCSSGRWAPPPAITPAPSPNCSHCLRTDAANLACRPSDNESASCVLLLLCVHVCAEKVVSNCSRSPLIYSVILALHVTWKFQVIYSQWAVLRSTFKCELLHCAVKRTINLNGVNKKWLSLWKLRVI